MLANFISAGGRIAQAPPSGQLGHIALLCVALLVWAGQGRMGQDRPFTHSWPIHTLTEFSPQPCGCTPDYYFCFRLGERNGLAQGHAESRLESRQSISCLTL